MARLIEVADPADERLADYRDLRDVTLRRSIESEHGLFLAEGEKVVRRAVNAGYPVRSLLMAPRWVESLGDVLATTDAPCYVLRRRLVEQVTGMVRWTESVTWLTKEGGVANLVELGTGKVLTGLAKRIAPDASAQSVGSPADTDAFAAQLGA